MSTQKTKKCTLCEETKPLSEYYRVGGKCKECVKKLQRERNKATTEQRKELEKDPDALKEPKTCTKCHETKTVGDFRVGRGKCNDCERERGRKYGQEHKDLRRKWHEENKEHHAELSANWYQENKPKIREKYTERYANDKCFKIHRLLKGRLSNKIEKIKTTKDYVGTSFENVAKWLEYNFTDDMTWENHGIVWDIDHVIPVSRWDLTDEKQTDACFNWKNLSPLDSIKNRHLKRSKIDCEQVARHIEKLREYFMDNKLDETELTSYIECYEKMNTKNKHRVHKKIQNNDEQKKYSITLMGETP